MALFDTREKRILGVVVGGGIAFIGLTTYLTAKKGHAAPAIGGAEHYGVKCTCATVEVVNQPMYDAFEENEYLQAVNAKITDPWAISRRIYSKICPGCTLHPSKTKYPNEALTQFYLMEHILEKLQRDSIIDEQAYNAYILEGAAWAVRSGIEWSKILPDIGGEQPTETP
jgi:hypothetical protein